MIVYKGTDKDMVGRGHQFQMGKNAYDGYAMLRNRGFHAQDAIQGVFRWYPAYHNNRYFECECEPVDSDGGLIVTDKIDFLKELSEQEIRDHLHNLNLGYNVVEACYPINPLLVNNQVEQIDIENIKLWASVYAFVRDSVHTSVRDSMWNSVYAFVWASVRDSMYASVRDSMYAFVHTFVWISLYAYVGSLFPNIADWKYTKHETGVYPFQCGADLWRRGFIPLKVDGVWCLWSQGKIVYRENVTDEEN